MSKKSTFGDLTGDSRPGGSNVVTKKKIPELHKGTKAQAEKYAKAVGVGGPSRMPKPDPITVEDTNVRVIKKRED